MGVNKEIKEMLEHVNPLDHEDLIYIAEYGFRYGSSVYGGFKKGKSDVDFIMAPDFNIENLSRKYVYLSNDYSESTSDFNGFYCKTEYGEVLNLMHFFTEAEYKKYIWCSERMKFMCDSIDINFSNKTKRVKDV